MASNRIMYKLTPLVLSLAFLGGSQAVIADTVDFYTEQLPPYNYQTKSGVILGYSVDIIREVFKKLNRPSKEIKVVPWSRGYRLTLEPNQQRALFSMSKNLERTNKFKWVGPITTGHLEIFCRHDLDFFEKKLAHYTYSAIRDDIGHLELKAAGVPDDAITVVSDYRTMYLLVSTDRVNCFPYDRDTKKYLDGILKLDFSLIE